MMTTMFRTGLVLGALGLASPAFAQGILNTPVDGSNALEFRFSRFNPGIDEEFDGGATPYGTAFDDKRPINFELEYDRQFWDGFGSIGIGVNLGYNRVRGNAVTLDGESSPDRTTLGVIPVRVGAVYRFDVLQRRYNVPFVIVAKLGLDYAFWTIRDGDRNVSEVPTTDGSTIEGTGGTAGWHGAVGLHLLLDWFSPVMANAFASNVGVVNSYFFAEYMVSRVDDFGSDTSWSLSQNQLWLGLAFEF